MTAKTCPACHGPIPADAPGGLCPACVLRDAEEPAPRGRSAPIPDEISAAFPRLEILGLIGQGGMGFVYRARQPDLDRIIAVKILSPELGRDPAFAERFAREARTLAKLHHPNIVTVFEHGESGGFFYLLMEYVDGVNLRQAMRAGRFTPDQALAIVPGICDALQAAHAQGIWHRDIKPENILLDREGRVKIADFGIARIVGDPQRDFTLTMTGNALGSAAYMAPEQHEKPHDVDHRADIYSLGVVIYEMLTGELPLGRFPLPSQRAEVNARIDEVVLRTLEKERELRQQSAEEVKTEVEGAESKREGPEDSLRPPFPKALPFAFASGVVSLLLWSSQGAWGSDDARALNAIFLKASILSAAVLGIATIYIVRPSRVVGLLGAALFVLILLLVIEGRGAITLAVVGTTMLVAGAASMCLLTSRPSRKPASQPAAGTGRQRISRLVISVVSVSLAVFGVLAIINPSYLRSALLEEPAKQLVAAEEQEDNRADNGLSGNPHPVEEKAAPVSKEPAGGNDVSPEEESSQGASPALVPDQTRSTADLERDKWISQCPKEVADKMPHDIGKLLSELGYNPRPEARPAVRMWGNNMSNFDNDDTNDWVIHIHSIDSRGKAISGSLIYDLTEHGWTLIASVPGTFPVGWNHEFEGRRGFYTQEAMSDEPGASRERYYRWNGKRYIEDRVEFARGG
jgi:serine/threonine protein kinase